MPTGRGDGVPVASLVDLQDGAKPVQMLSGKDEARFVVAGSGGYGFIAKLGDMAGRVKAGKAFLTLNPEESVLTPAPLPAAGLGEATNWWPPPTTAGCWPSPPPSSRNWPRAAA